MYEYLDRKDAQQVVKGLARIQIVLVAAKIFFCLAASLAVLIFAVSF